jgi:hypothetical protein
MSKTNKEVPIMADVHCTISVVLDDTFDARQHKIKDVTASVANKLLGHDEKSTIPFTIRSIHVSGGVVW